MQHAQLGQEELVVGALPAASRTAALEEKIDSAACLCNRYVTQKPKSGILTF